MNFVARAAVGLVLIAAAAPNASANDVMDYYNQPEVRKALGMKGARQAAPRRATQRAVVSRPAPRQTLASRLAVQRASVSRPQTDQTPDSQPIRNAAVPFAGTSNPHWISVAQRYKGTNPTGRKSLWCADFMNLVLNRSGLQGTSSSTARSFASYGQRLSGPKVGAIAILARGKNGGHVGIVTGIDPKGNPVLLSGNHNNRVAEASYPQSRVIAYVWPTS